VSEMLPTALSSSLLAGWWSICFIRWTFNTRVPLLTQLVVQVIFLTIYMQRHRHVECLTRMLSQPLLSRKCIPQLAFGCFEREIPSVKHVGFSCPATAPKVLNLGHCVQRPLLHVSRYFGVAISIHCIQC
jgi:hypothetical protein